MLFGVVRVDFSCCAIFGSFGDLVLFGFECLDFAFWLLGGLFNLVFLNLVP